MKKSHYYLLPAEVRYEVKGVPHLIKFDTLTKKDQPFINMRDLGEAQQASQVRLFREVIEPTPDVQVMDVCILSVSYLGEMTEEEFNSQPERMPSDTPPEDKPAQETVEGSPTQTAPVPVEAIDIPAADAPSELPHDSVVNADPTELYPAEPTNEADRD